MIQGLGEIHPFDKRCGGSGRQGPSTGYLRCTLHSGFDSLRWHLQQPFRRFTAVGRPLTGARGGARFGIAGSPEAPWKALGKGGTSRGESGVTPKYWGLGVAEPRPIMCSTISMGHQARKLQKNNVIVRGIKQHPNKPRLQAAIGLLPL